MNSVNFLRPINNNHVWSVIYLSLGIISLFNFYVGLYFPISVSVILMILVVIYCVRQFIEERVGLLIVILLLVYLLPFIHIPPYIWFDFEGEIPQVGFGRLASNPYMFDRQVIELTAMLGATGALGIAYAVSLRNRRILRDTGKNPNGSPRIFRTLEISIWLVWVAFGLAFSWISAPQETVFTTSYTLSTSISDAVNFSSAWMISYVILSFAFIDALLDANRKRQKFKIKVALAVVAIVVIWLQLLRGNRESIPWVFGLIIAYYYWGSAYRPMIAKIKLSWFKVLIYVFALLFISLVVGTVRSNLEGIDFSQAIMLIQDLFNQGAFGFNNYLSGTWSAVLLTPMSVAGDYIDGLLTMKWGKDYFDIILSLPPGFVADIIGYERPLSSFSGAAWDMRYGLGGTHAVVLPFRNFQMIGVFLIPALWTLFFSAYESSVVSRVSVSSLSALVTVAMAAPHWLWYGEKSIINALISWAVMTYFYKVSLGLNSSARKG